MQSGWIGPAVLFALLGAGDASAAGSPAFCRTWLRVCNQTCPNGPGTCTACAMGVIRPVCRPGAFRSTFPVHAARTAQRTRPRPRRPERRSMRAAPLDAARASAEGLATSAPIEGNPDRLLGARPISGNVYAGYAGVTATGSAPLFTLINGGLDGQKCRRCKTSAAGVSGPDAQAGRRRLAHGQCLAFPPGGGSTARRRGGCEIDPEAGRYYAASDR